MLGLQPTVLKVNLPIAYVKISISAIKINIYCNNGKNRSNFPASYKFSGNLSALSVYYHHSPKHKRDVRDVGDVFTHF